MHALAPLIVGASSLALAVLSPFWRASAQRPSRTPVVRLAELEIDPAQLTRYRAALLEEVETSVRVEPGVLTLYSVAVKGHPARIRLFEMYADSAAYNAHIASPHFQKYKSGTSSMVKSLTLLETEPVFLGTKNSEVLGAFVNVR